MRKILSMLTTAALAAGLSLATATPAAAEEYCVGAPSEPLAYVCVGIGVGEPTLDPLLTWGEPQPVTIRSLCYGVGCTEETTVTYVSLPTGVGQGPAWPVEITITWNGYSLPDDLGYIIDDAVSIAMRVIERYVGPFNPPFDDLVCLTTEPEICLL